MVKANEHFKWKIGVFCHQFSLQTIVNGLDSQSANMTFTIIL